MILIKYTGITLIILSFSVYGFLKSRTKSAYIGQLQKINEAILNTDNMLRLGAESKTEILKKSFKDIEGITVGRSGVYIDESTIKGELKKDLDTFFLEFGSGDTALERQRAEGLKHSVMQHIKSEKKKYEQSYKIWQTAGVCAGLIIGIMLI